LKSLTVHYLVLVLTHLVEDADLDELLGESVSRSGDGMKTAGEGTSTSVSGDDNSSLNLDNAA
jgi:hypothetical protein